MLLRMTLLGLFLCGAAETTVAQTDYACGEALVTKRLMSKQRRTVSKPAAMKSVSSDRIRRQANMIKVRQNRRPIAMVNHVEAVHHDSPSDRQQRVVAIAASAEEAATQSRAIPANFVDNRRLGSEPEEDSDIRDPALIRRTQAPSHLRNVNHTAEKSPNLEQKITTSPLATTTAATPRLKQPNRGARPRLARTMTPEEMAAFVRKQRRKLIRWPWQQ